MVDHQYADIFQLECSLKPREKSFWGRLYGSAKALAISNLSQQADTILVVIVEDMLAGTKLAKEICFYLDDSSANVLFFPDWGVLPYDFLSPDEDIISQRLATLASLLTLDKGMLIVPVAALMCHLMPKEFLLTHSVMLRCQQALNIEQFKQQLLGCGYTFTAQVLTHGDVAIRGSLIDLYPMGASNPYRIDMLDDTIDSIHIFDVNMQHTLEKVEYMQILPAREVPLTSEYITAFQSAWRAYYPDNSEQSLIYSAVSQGYAPVGIEYYLSLFYQQTSTFFDYLPNNSVLLFDEDVTQHAESVWQDITSRYEKFEHDIEHPVLQPKDVSLNVNQLLSMAKKYHQIHLMQKPQKARNGTANYDAKLLQNLRIDGRAKTPLLLLKRFLNGFSGRVLLVAESEGRRGIIFDMLAANALQCVSVSGWSEFINGQMHLALTVAPIEQGMQLGDSGLAVISEWQLFGASVMNRHLRKRKQQDPETIIQDLTELHVSDAIVHEEHGVGRYQGLCILEVGDVPAEFITIEYAAEEKLYIPISALDLISRFSAVDMENAPLHRLGSGHWRKLKSKAAKRIHDIAAELLDLHARRAAFNGFQCTLDQSAYSAFVQKFPFAETHGQMEAIDAVIRDMTSSIPMDRLICGDAGFGKTEVAMRAAFVAVHNYRQVAILAPTTLLVQQHQQNFIDRFADFPVRVASLSRFSTVKQQKEVLRGIESGDVNIVIGTHKLIQGNIKFANLGLVIIDEEHRFGVRQKEKFKSIRTETDLLALTATPIPRTLSMALSNIREFSIITTPPAKRLAAKTFVCAWDDALLQEALLREIKRGGQVYVLHNEIKTIEKMLDRIQALVPSASIRWAHGKMTKKMLEQVMFDFYRRRFDILVCTTIIETGIDVPNANTIIVNNADRFGLAQIYQLRGRVGRSHHRAYVYLLIPEKQTMSEQAIKRLSAVEALDELGVGFSLATHDLEIRGAGEVLGDEQSGQICEIGYGLYMDLLQRAMSDLKSGKQVALDSALDHGAEINLHIASLIPEDYLPDVNMRLTLYKRIASAASKEALIELQVEIVDRFGILPEFAKNLFQIAQLKLLVKPFGIGKIDIGQHGGRVQFNKNNLVDAEKIIMLIKKEPSVYKFDGQDKLRISKELLYPADRFKLLHNLIENIMC